MTEKENLLRVYSGQVPEWVPRYTPIRPSPNLDYHPACFQVEPSILSNRIINGVEYDIWGTQYAGSEAAGDAKMPDPGKPMFDDITKWRDYVKAPDFSDVDFERLAKHDMQYVDRRESAVELRTHIGYFQRIMAFMGFADGLVALFEDPDEVYAMLEYISDFYEPIVRKAVDFYRPDVLAIIDDTATALNPFISLDMYRELIRPFHERLAKIANDAGIFINMHCCGHCEAFIEDWLEMGVRIWNPAQVMNDLPAIKKQYGNRLVLNGCWDSSGAPSWPGASEELIRAEVRKCIDAYAPGGGFCFMGGVVGNRSNPEVQEKTRWITDEYNRYGKIWYKTH